MTFGAPTVNVSISLSSGFSFQAIADTAIPEGSLKVSISLSSGFSFQVNQLKAIWEAHLSFNLVIERLLISGKKKQPWLYVLSIVSISLSSGFSFQGNCRNLRRKRRSVSISLSSGFSFQGWIVVSDAGRVTAFQSRYRAASHFRSDFDGNLTTSINTRFNLVIERLLISGKD